MFVKWERINLCSYFCRSNLFHFYCFLFSSFITTIVIAILWFYSYLSITFLSECTSWVQINKSYIEYKKPNDLYRQTYFTSIYWRNNPYFYITFSNSSWCSDSIVLYDLSSKLEFVQYICRYKIYGISIMRMQNKHIHQ